jgi:SNF2 family DNA or RNA helicase
MEVGTKKMTELFVSAQHKMLVVPKATAVANMFPAAQVVTLKGNEFHLVPHHPAEAFLLRTMGYTVPAPILTHYDWPGDKKPFDAQRQTAGLLTMNKRAYVLNSMGTGKTKAALWAWDYLRSRGLAKKMLVISPLSTLKFTWDREVFNTLPHRKSIVVHHSSRAKRVERLNDPEADILIINHDGAKLLHNEIAALIKAGVIDTICIDELAVYRNGKSIRTKSMKELAKGCEWVWGMTGSPMPRSPTDVWSQCQIITPHTVDKFFGHFRDRVLIKINQFKYAPKANAVETAYGVMQPAVRFTMDDVQELPELVVQTRDIPMGAVQAKIYKALAGACHAALGKQEITAANAGAVMLKLLQVATGWVYDKERAVVTLDGKDRIEALVETIDQAEQKVLVFVPFIHALDGISAALTAEGIDHAVVSGNTAIGARSTIFNDFQNTAKYKVLVAHPQCLAHGITLTTANTIVWYAPVTSLEIYEQANARIRRVGQRHKQLVLHLQSTPVERKIYKLLQNNQQVQDAFLAMFADETMQNPIT